MRPDILFAPRSNREIWVETFEFRDNEADEPIQLTFSDGTPRFQMTAVLRCDGPRSDLRWQYTGPFYDFPSIAGARVVATIGAGITIVDPGAIVVSMGLQGLCPGRWQFTLLIADDEVSMETHRGILPILPY